MQVLGGNQVVFYAAQEGSYLVQLEDCLSQLEEYMDEYQIYPGSFIRHNIFVAVDNQLRFEKEIPQLITVAKRRFPMPLIVNVIPQKPAEGQVALESTHIQSTKWNCLFKEVKGGSCQHIVSKDHEIVIGSIHFDRAQDFQQSVEKAFQGMEKLLEKCNMGIECVVKQWSYIERMFDNELKVQRYQIFNDVRTKYFDEDFNNIGYPSSTEVGVKSGGILIEFFAIKNAKGNTKVINNPVQKAPYKYSADVLSERGIFDRSRPTTPKVERARFVKVTKHSMAFVSATAAIIGERVTALGDVKEQTIVIIENLKKLLSKVNLEDSQLDVSEPGKYTLVKAYVQHASDFEKVYGVLDSFFGDIPLVLVQAELPRQDILVEVEAEMLF